ncbi:MAG TPA: helix-turn-helix domain-containing protein [Blastocatellia bacterium]
MLYRTYTPGPPLSDFVELFWLNEGEQVAHAKERILPTASSGLIINLKADKFRVYPNPADDSVELIPGSLVAGPRSEYTVIDAPSGTSLIGVHFKPGGGFPFFEVPAGELHNSTVSLDLLWGTWARELRERLIEEQSVEGRFRILEQTLLTQAVQAARPQWRSPVVSFALDRFQSRSSVSAVTDSIGLSPRRFIQVFNDEVGLTPKLFCRVVRFQDVLRTIHGEASVDWADLALSCNYFDQAHFIHDFKAFSGISPTTYLASQTQYPNHVPLPD